MYSVAKCFYIERKWFAKLLKRSQMIYMKMTVSFKGKSTREKAEDFIKKLKIMIEHLEIGVIYKTKTHDVLMDRLRRLEKQGKVRILSTTHEPHVGWRKATRRLEDIIVFGALNNKKGMHDDNRNWYYVEFMKL